MAGYGAQRIESYAYARIHLEGIGFALKLLNLVERSGRKVCIFQKRRQCIWIIYRLHLRAIVSSNR